MIPLLKRKVFIFTCFIFSCCFLTDLTVEVTSKNYLEHFTFKDEKNLLKSESTNIDQISWDAFNSVRNCKVFKITDQKRLSTLPENLFDEKKAFQNVTILIFKNTGIKKLPQHMFRKLEKLENFFLISNKMERLHSNLFQSNTKLRLVYIWGNKLLKSLPPDLFKTNREITDVFIAKNSMLETLPQVFQNLVKRSRIRLHLKGNNLTFIEHETFSSLNTSEINQMDISNNYLVCLPDYFVNITNIPQNERRNKIVLSGNCFDESSQICKLYTCNNRPAKQCEGARNSINIRRCQQGYEQTNYGVDNDTVISKNEDNNDTSISKDSENKVKNNTTISIDKMTEVKNVKNISENTKDELKRNPVETRFIVFSVIIFCLIVAIVASVYALCKQSVRINRLSKPNKDTQDNDNCDFYDYVSGEEN